jgi:ribosomal protein L37E
MSANEIYEFSENGLQPEDVNREKSNVIFARCDRCGYVHIVFDLNNWTEICRRCDYNLFNYREAEPRVPRKGGK